jgi:alanine racemase
MSRGTTAIINLGNLKHNYSVLKKMAPNKLVLVIKADAYGHGIKQVVQTLGKVDCYAVATIDEALTIRAYNKKVKILLLEGFFSQDELTIALDNNLDCVIHQQQQLSLIDKVKTHKKLNAWIKYDSGMNRLGFNDSDFQEAIEILKEHKNINLITLMSHFASANIPENNFTDHQKQRFLKFQHPYPLSLSNSSALLTNKNLNDEWCRVGITLFGVSPIQGKLAKDFNLKPVMTLKTNVIAIKHVKKGQAIGYSQTYKTKTEKKIAIIGIGYGDGYPWILSEQALVKINKSVANIVGRVSMDMMAIDISRIKNVNIGDSALIWGPDGNDELPIEIVASHAQTIPYVLLCQITSRVHYKYV